MVSLPACIRLDTQTVGFSGWRQGERLHLADPVAGCFFILHGREVDIIAPVAREQSRIALLGLVREAITGRMAGSRPTLDLHAAGFVAGGRAVLLAGPKMAGKTTMLCHMLLSAGTALLANDRTFVHLDGAAPVAYGIPTVGSFRPGTLERFPQLLERADAYPASVFAAPGTPPAPGLRLTPARLAGRLGIVQTPQAPVQAVLLPEITAEISGYTLVPLTGGEALASLKACLYGVPEDRERPTLFASLMGPARPVALLIQRLERLVTTVPILRLRMGKEVYDESALPILSALGLEGP